MIYLKLFEGFDSQYMEISDEEWEEWEDEVVDYNMGNIEKPFIDFPLKDFLILRDCSVSPDTWYLTNNKKYDHGYSFNKSHTGIMWINNTIVNNVHLYVTVWYCYDYWYMVEISGNGICSHYKCDDFEGLKNLLKDNRIIK